MISSSWYFSLSQDHSSFSMYRCSKEKWYINHVKGLKRNHPLQDKLLHQHDKICIGRLIWLCMKLLSSAITTRVWRIWTLLHGILESYIEARRLFPGDKVSLIWSIVQHSPSPYPPPPPHLPPCGYMMQCYFGKCPLLLS